MNSRERYLDIAKGIGILSIVLLHFLGPECISSLRIYIGLYMITIFYVVVGWIDAERTVSISSKELIIKRWKQLGVPYVSWTLIILSFDLLLFFGGYYDGKFILREVYKSFVLRGIGTLWFLPALFFGELLWNYVKKKNNAWLIVSCIVFVLCYDFLYSKVFADKVDTIGRIIDAPFHTINNILNAFLFIAGGYALCLLYKRYKDMCNKYIWGIIGLAVCICMYMWTYYVKIPVIGTTIISLLTPWGIIMLAKSVQDLKCWNYLSYWGQHSLGLMVTHYSILLPICVIIQNYILDTAYLRLHGWRSALYIIPVMIIEYYLVSFVEKKYPRLLGK